MKTATVIGLGQMGSTLARLLLRSGYRVTVWNRSAARAAPLVQEGAVLAPSVAAAVAASPVVVVCVLDYAATREVLGAPDVRAALAGRTLVQLTTGSPAEAREGEAWARAQGTGYLDGAILATPHQMGQPDTTLLVAGAEDTFGRQRQLLGVFGGGVTYLGGQVGAAAVMDMAVLSHLYGSLMGFLHGVRIVETEGLRADAFGKLTARLAPALAQILEYEGQVIQSGDFAVTQSSVAISLEATERLVRAAQDAGINAEIPAFAASFFQRAVRDGYGDQEAAALVKVLRGRPG